MKSKIKVTLLITSIFLGSYFLFQTLSETFKEDTWKGFYYPDGNKFEPIYSGDFLTHSDCINWAKSVLNSRPQDKEVSIGDLYECGKNCKVTDTYKYLVKNKPDYQFKNYPTYVCDETY